MHLFFIIFLCIIIAIKSSPCLDYDSISNKCHLCSFNYNLNTFFSFSNINDDFDVNSCEIKSNTTVYKEIYVASGVSCENHCLGTETEPFDNLFAAFSYIMTNFNNNSYLSIVIFLMNEESHYFYNTSGEAENFYLMRRMNISLTIKPLFCLIKNIPGCLNMGKKSEIVLKSNKLFIFISHQLIIENIVFNGIDLGLSENHNFYGYLNETVCSEADLLNTTDKINIKSQCLLKNKTSLTTNNYGFFNVEPIFDCKDCNNTTNLHIIDCHFRYINSISSWTSLIKIFKGYPIMITITNTIFYKLFFFNGIMSILNSADSYYKYISQNTFTAFLDNIQNKEIFCNFQNNSLRMFNYFNLAFDGIVNIFDFNYTYNKMFSQKPPSLFINISSDQYTNNYIEQNTLNFIFIESFSSESTFIMSNITSSSNCLDNFVNVQCLFSKFEIKSSIFSNNIKNTFCMSSKNTFLFSNNSILNHSLNNNNLFSISETKIFIFNSLFENIFNSDGELSSLIDIATILKQNIQIIFYKGNSENYTQDEIHIRDSAFKRFFNVNIIESTTTIRYFFIHNSNFSTMSLIPLQQSLIECYIENLIEINKTIFESIVGKYIFEIRLSRNRTFNDIQYTNSQSLFLYLFFMIMTPSFHSMYCNFTQVRIENIFAINDADLQYFIVFMPNYNVDTVDLIFLDSYFRNVSFAYCELSNGNILFLVLNPYYMYAWNITFLEIANSSIFYLQSQYDFPFNSIINITNMKIINELYDSLSLCAFYYIPVFLIKNSIFRSDKLLIQSPAIYLECFPICYLLFINNTVMNCKPFYKGKGGALALKYQNIKRILIKDCYFKKNGQIDSSFADIGLIFMEQLTSLLDFKNNSSLMFDNYYEYCFDLEYTSEIIDEKVCKNITINNITNISIGNAFVFFNVNEWNTLIFTYGIQNSYFLNGKSSALQISEKSDCVLKNLIFSQYSSYYSSIIRANKGSSIYLYESLINYCNSVDNGGSFYLDTSSFAFIANTSFENISSVNFGGILYIQEANLILSNVSTVDCSSDEGGIIYAQNSVIKGSYIIIANSLSRLLGGSFYFSLSEIDLINIFTIKSKSYFDGGIIYSDNSKKFNVKNAIMTESTALNYGNFYVKGIANLLYLFENLTFVSNYANEGGCIYLKEGSIVLNSSKLLNNSANTYLIYGVSSFSKVGFDIKSTVFYFNKVNLSLVYFEKAQINVRESLFQDNSFLQNAISLWFSVILFDKLQIIFSPDFRIDQENITNIYALLFFTSSGEIINSVLNFSVVNIGGILNENSILNISFNSFLSCKGGNGGAIQLTGLSHVYIFENLFYKNVAEYGAAIYVMNSFLVLQNNRLIENYGKSKGSDVYVSNLLVDNKEEIRIANNVFHNFHLISSVFIQIFSLKIFNNSFIQDNYPDISDKNAIFYLTSENSSQAIYLESVLSAVLKDLLIYNLLGLSAIQSVNTNQITLELTINSTKFLNCSSKTSGGGLFLIGSFNFTLMNCFFLNNFALLNGGAIYGFCVSEPGLFYNLTNNSFIENSAKIYGGAIKFPYMEDDLTLKNIFYDNSAQIGNIISTNAAKIYVVNNLSELNASQNLFKPLGLIFSQNFLSVSSGQEAQFYVLILDSINNFLMYEDSAEITIEIPINSSNSDYLLNMKKYENLNLINYKIGIKSGVAFFNSFILIGEPGQNYTATITYKNIGISYQKNIDLRVNYCKVGEIYVNSQCIPCGKGFYSLDNNTFSTKKNSCELCPDNSNCYGLNYIIPDSGYWRKDSNSILMIPCLNSENCPDQTNYFLLTLQNYSYVCRQGSYGNLCANCVSGYGKDSNAMCHQCSTDKNIYAKFFLFSFFSVIFLAYQSTVALKFDETDTIKRSMLKLIINHNYYLSFLQNLKVDWIGNLKDFSSYSDMYATSVPKDILNFDCLVTDNFEAESMPTLKSAAFSFFPLLLFALILITRIIWFLIGKIISFKKNKDKSQKIRQNAKKNRKNNEVITIVAACFLVTVYNFYSRLIMNTLQILKCINLDQTQSTFLEFDPNIECWVDGGTHIFLIKTLFLLNFLLWCIGWPISLVLILKIKNYTHIKELMKFSTILKSSISSASPKKMQFQKKTSILANIYQNISKFRTTSLKSKQDLSQPEPPKELINSSVNKQTRPSKFASLAGSEPMIKGIANLANAPSNFRINKINEESKGSSKKILIHPTPIIVKESVESQESQKSIESEIKKNMSSSLKKRSKKISLMGNDVLLTPQQKDQIFQKNKIFKFLTIDYRPNFYFWEAFFYLSNLIIAILNVTTSRLDSNSQGGIFISIYFLMLLINEVFKPFRYGMVNKFASFSYLTNVLTIGLVLMSLTSNNKSFQSTLYFIVMIIINCLFYVSWCFKFGKIVILDNFEKIKKVGRFLKQKTSNLWNKSLNKKE